MLGRVSSCLYAFGSFILVYMLVLLWALRTRTARKPFYALVIFLFSRTGISEKLVCNNFYRYGARGVEPRITYTVSLLRPWLRRCGDVILKYHNLLPVYFSSFNMSINIARSSFHRGRPISNVALTTACSPIKLIACLRKSLSSYA